jgi:ATP-binding cassette subfamily C (CFTR/MRP) protein 1
MGIGIITVLLRLVVVCITAKYISATIPFTFLIIYLIQRFYLRTSRQLRYLDIEAKAPLYSHFLETLQGLATVRAFGWENSFKARTHMLLDASQKPYYLLQCIQRWLTFVLDCLTGTLGLLIVVLAVTLKGKGGMSAGETGVALINIVSFNQILAQLINSWTMLETSIGAVSRIRSFEKTTRSEIREAVRPDPRASWPENGAIEIKNVTASYE